MPASPNLAAEEREAARSSPAALAVVASRGSWKPARHLLYLNRQLVRAAVRPGIRLLISCPPQHGKSTITSGYAPAWYLGNYPDKTVILATYEAGVSRKWGRRARAVIARYGPELFGISLSEESHAADRWEIAGHTGGMVASGIGGPITGEPGHLFLIDDPLKNSEQANSPTVRENQIDWWLSTGKSRLHEESSVVLLMTRWHSRDLGGYLKDEEGFEEIRLPALAEEDDPLGREPGEALWPEEFSREYLEGIRDSPSGAYWFGSMYQGRPVPRKGGMFERDKIAVVDAVPAGCKFVRWWDIAAGKKAEKSDPDYTVGAKIAKAPDGRLYVVDVRRGRWRAKDLEERLKAVATQDGTDVPVWLEQEPGSEGELWITGTVVPLLAGYPVHWKTSSGDKVLRAEPWSSQWTAGNVSLLRGIWNEAYVAEHEGFPRGTHDDQVDASAAGYQALIGGGAADRYLSDAAPECPKCGGPNIAGAVSCRWCGAGLRKEE